MSYKHNSIREMSEDAFGKDSIKALANLEKLLMPRRKECCFP